MGELFVSILCGGLTFFCIAYILSQTKYFDVKHPKAGWTISGVASFVSFILFFFLFVQDTNIGMEKFCAEFEAKKFTYETAMADKNITGLERLQITNTIMYINADLAKEKIDIVQWYSFAVSNDNVERVLSLSPIQ